MKKLFMILGLGKVREISGGFGEAVKRAEGGVGHWKGWWGGGVNVQFVFLIYNFSGSSDANQLQLGDIVTT